MNRYDSLFVAEPFRKTAPWVPLVVKNKLKEKKVSSTYLNYRGGQNLCLLIRVQQLCNRFYLKNFPFVFE